MKWRRTEEGDIPRIRELHAKAGYGFEFPLGKKHAYLPRRDPLLSSWVAEEDGQVVCWAGAILQPEVMAIMDPDYGSPHQRMKAFASFHPLLAKDLAEQGHKRAFANLDPRFPGFGRHLKPLGWWPVWRQVCIWTKDWYKHENND